MSKVRSVINFIRKYFFLIKILIFLAAVGFFDVIQFICAFVRKIFQVQCLEIQISFLQLIATIVAGTWALVLYYQKNRIDKNKFLKIFLETKIENEHVIISTRLHNDTENVRKIELAFLIINEAKNPQLKLKEKSIHVNQEQDQQELRDLQLDDTHAYLKKVNKYFGTCFKSSEHLTSLIKFNSFKSEDKKFYFIQLPYYTSENIQISNEELTFDYTFLQNELKNGIYDVRFFVYPTDDEFPNLERIVHKSLIIKNENHENNN